MPERFRAPLFSRHRRGKGSGSPGEVVDRCQQYSARLKEEPLGVWLHVSIGHLADGTVGLETNADGVVELVVKAMGSTLFGLVKKEHRHAFTPGELERSNATSFLLRSVKALVKGDEKDKEKFLARSLSLVHASEAVDITCRTIEDHDRLRDWIDANWSVAKITESFRANPRTILAMQGKKLSLHRRGIYEALDQLRKEQTQEEEESVLPKLEPDKRRKLQDDLVYGVHVTYHDKGALNTRGAAYRLRYNSASQDGTIKLEPSFGGSDPVIEKPIRELVQIGGGPSAYSITGLLFRATMNNPDKRESAVSLVFNDMSMDMTFGSKEDARELVLYFSELKGFTRAAPASKPSHESLPKHIRAQIEEVAALRRQQPHRAVSAIDEQFEVVPPEDQTGSTSRALSDSRASDMQDHSRKAVQHILDPPRSHRPPAMASTSGHEHDKLKKRVGEPLRRGVSTSSIGTDDSEFTDVHSTTWSSRYIVGLDAPGDKEAFRRQMSARSTFDRAQSGQSTQSGLSVASSEAPAEPLSSVRPGAGKGREGSSQAGAGRGSASGGVPPVFSAPSSSSSSSSSSSQSRTGRPSLVIPASSSTGIAGGIAVGGVAWPPQQRRTIEGDGARRPNRGSGEVGSGAPGCRRATVGDSPREGGLSDIYRAREQVRARNMPALPPRPSSGAEGARAQEAGGESRTGRNPGGGSRTPPGRHRNPGDEPVERDRRYGSSPSSLGAPYRMDLAATEDAPPRSRGSSRPNPQGRGLGGDMSRQHHQHGRGHASVGGSGQGGSGGVGVSGSGSGTGNGNGKPYTLRPVPLSKAIPTGEGDDHRPPKIFTTAPAASPTSRFGSTGANNAVPFLTPDAVMRSRVAAEGSHESPLTRSDHDWSSRAQRRGSKFTLAARDARRNLRSTSPVERRPQGRRWADEVAGGVQAARDARELSVDSPVQLRARAPPSPTDRTGGFAGGSGFQAPPPPRSPTSNGGNNHHSNRRTSDMITGMLSSFASRASGSGARSPGKSLSPPNAGTGVRPSRRTRRFSSNPGGVEDFSGSKFDSFPGQTRTGFRRMAGVGVASDQHATAPR